MPLTHRRLQIKRTIEKSQQKADSLEVLLYTATQDKALLTKSTDWKKLQLQLNEKEALIEIVRVKHYKIDNYAYIALIVKKGLKRPIMVVLDNGEELETKYLSYYRNAIKYKKTDNNSYQQYFQKFSPYLEGVEKIYFSPDGVYHQINIASLYNSEQQQYLIEKYYFTLLGSPTDLLNKKSTEL